MMNFNFIASDKFELTDLNDIEKFVDRFPDFQTVTLKDENQLKLLLELMGIDDFQVETLNKTEFEKFWDLSDFRLPEYNEDQFDQFYREWLRTSGRDNNMDEYGNLIFLQGVSSRWNQMKYRLIVKEN
jgi:hypothetical protein